MASVVDVQNTLPLGYTIPPLISTSKSVLRKTLVSIQPNNTGTYSFANSKIQFNIGNNTSFLVGPESYVRVEFFCSASTPSKQDGGGTTINTVALADTTFLGQNIGPPHISLDNIASLDIGGIHACFKTMRVSAISQGTTIQQCDEYNRYNAAISVMTDTDSKIDIEHWRFGDSSNSGLVAQKPWKLIPLVAGAAGSTTVGGHGHYLSDTTHTPLVSIAVSGGTPVTNPAFTVFEFNEGVVAWLDAQPGDLMMFTIESIAPIGTYVATGGSTGALGVMTRSIVARVLWANANTGAASPVIGTTDTIALDVILASTDVAAAATNFVRNATYIKTFSQASARSLVCNGRRHVLEIHPRMSFFDLDFPLFILRNGIMLEMELDHPAKVLKFLNGADVNSTARSNAGDYFFYMEQVLFWGKFSTPHPSVVSTFVELWNSDRGLSYPIPSYVVRTYTGAQSGNDTIRVNLGVRSLRRVFTVIYDQEMSENQSKCTQYNDALSSFFRASVYTFQYQVGSFNFPNQKVYCYGVSQSAVNTMSGVVSNGAAYPQFIPTASGNAGSAGGQFPVNATSKGYFNDAYAQVPYEAREHAAQTYVSDYESRINLSQVLNCHAYIGKYTNATPIAVVEESNRFFMVADMSRDNGPGGYLTGTDTSIVPLQLNVERNSNNYTSTNLQIPRYYIFGDYDAYLTLSSQGIFLLT